MEIFTIFSDILKENASGFLLFLSKKQTTFVTLDQKIYFYLQKNLKYRLI